MRWRLFPRADPKVEQRLEEARLRDAAVMEKADHALKEMRRLELLRSSFARAGRRLGA